MNVFIFIAAFATDIFLSCTAQALPHIVFYNYAPPVPVFQMIASIPQDHQAFNVSPSKISLSFNEAVNPTNAEVKLFDPANNPVDSKVSLPNSTSIETPLPPHLLAGTYRVEWRAQCGCTEKTPLNGTVYFTIY